MKSEACRDNISNEVKEDVIAYGEKLLKKSMTFHNSEALDATM
jgi:hypothetical protein